MRNISERYYQTAHAIIIIFVADSADMGMLEEAKIAYSMVSSALCYCSARCSLLIFFLYYAVPIDAICDNEQVSGVSVLIMANTNLLYRLLCSVD